MTLRPLDRVGSIKLKLGVAIVVAVGASTVASFAIFVLTLRLSPPDEFPTWTRWSSLFVSFALPLALVQVLARGMTSPLREMAVAARRMAAGDREQRVTATSADEVGELARAFNDMAAELATVDRMRSDLIANVAHELRTPLAAIRAQLENLVYGVAEPRPEVLALMLDHTERLGRLVTQLLDLSRLESGTVPLHVEKVDVATLFEAVADEARTADPHCLVEMEVAPPGLMVEGDADRLHQVVANLTANALRHGPPGRRPSSSAPASTRTGPGQTTSCSP